MKSLAAAACLLFAASLLQAQSQPTAAPAEPAAPAAKPAPGKAPAAKVTKKVEPEAPIKIPGSEIARPDGTFLGLEVAGGKFKLSFYDAKKKPAKVNVTRATARWPDTRGPGDNRTVLNVSGDALVGAKPALPPYNFNVFLTLLQGEGDQAKAVENYVVPFRG